MLEVIAILYVVTISWLRSLKNRFLIFDFDWQLSLKLEERRKQIPGLSWDESCEGPSMVASIR